ncbi:hypothetical protein [Actinokineospora sp. UTMC 2448]|uniref:hypothetical protein n=1 Tax=Actinokineospora sp. UTMC 2448 TaxID=2268449 RepID=UPI0021645680|nr:hypothetical protein [Actinokineospora sp. UTMC 2448]UVS78193.1 hypothetical protein Actkin_01917 [Actinokineospora sp. UTMC 2448]
MQDISWRLVHDAVIPYGKAGYDTVVHARAFESGSDDIPVVVLGEFGDHRGRPLTQAFADAAAAAQAALYRRGDRLRFVHHTPHGQRFHEVRFHERRRTTVFYHRGAPPVRRGRSAHWSTSATAVTVRGARRHVFQPPRWQQDTPWTFHGPSWTELRVEGTQTIPQARSAQPMALFLPDLLGDTPIQVWPADRYLPSLIGGATARKLADARNDALLPHTPVLF